MGFLRKVLGGGSPGPDITVAAYMVVPDRQDATLEVVGEQSYQSEILAASGGRDQDGPIKKKHTALLRLEPDNRYDKDAICVWIEGRRVGYLSREDAIRYGPVFRWAAFRDHSIACEAYLKGGWDRGRRDQGSVGPVLHLGSPGETLMDVMGDEAAVKTDHPWPDHMIAFTGDSRMRLAGVDIDREWAAVLARKAGLHVHPRVTKKVQLLVDCDPGGESGNQLKAVEYGIAIVDEASFWSALGLPVERAERSLDASNVLHRFQASLAAAGLPRQRFHDLRHACATPGAGRGIGGRLAGPRSRQPLDHSRHVRPPDDRDARPRGRTDRRHPRPRDRLGVRNGVRRESERPSDHRPGVVSCAEDGPPGGIRTPDLLIRSQSL
jgi:hypothetical protein